MKKTKLAIILGICLLPVLATAQENQTNKIEKVITEITGNAVYFKVLDLDTNYVQIIQETINKQLDEIEQQEAKISTNNQTLLEKCPDLTEEQLKNVSRGIAQYKGSPSDIGCNDQAVYGLYVSPQFDDGYDWCTYQVVIWDKNTGEYIAVTRDSQIETAVIKTFEELEQYTGYTPKNARIHYWPQEEGQCKARPSVFGA